MLVLYSLHGRSLTFAASLCYLRHPTPKMGRGWLQLVLIEPFLESLRGLTPSPPSLLQLDTELLNKMTQGKHAYCVPASWSCLLTSDPGPSQRVLLHPPPPGHNQAPGLSTWIPCCPFLDATPCPQGGARQRHFQPVLMTPAVMGTKRLLKASSALSLKDRYMAHRAAIC